MERVTKRNTDSIAVRYLDGFNLQWTDQRSPDRQLVDAIICRWYGNVVASAIRVNAVLTGKS